MAPDGMVIRIFEDARKAKMCVIKPDYDGVDVLTENKGDYRVGNRVEWGGEIRQGKNCLFARILGPAKSDCGTHALEGKAAAPSNQVLFYDPRGHLGNIQDHLWASHSITPSTFDTVHGFFEMADSNQKGDDRVGCAVLYNLAIPLGEYPQKDLPKRFRRLALHAEDEESILGGAVIVDACIRRYKLPVLVNGLLNGYHEFLRNVPGVEPLPYGLLNQIQTILGKMGCTGVNHRSGSRDKNKYVGSRQLPLRQLAMNPVTGDIINPSTGEIVDDGFDAGKEDTQY